MSVTISDSYLTSDVTMHWAFRDQFNGRWHVTWLPGRQWTRDQATTAMVLAEMVAAMQEQGRTEVTDRTHPRWPHIDGWARELGLTGPNAVALASEGLDRAPVTWRQIPDGQVQDPGTGEWRYTIEGSEIARQRQAAEMTRGVGKGRDA